jgi:hypothetical protein
MRADRQPDPDEEGARWIAWIGERPGGPSIWDDVVAMIVSRQIWDGFRILYDDAPPEARTNATFQSWVNESYIHRQAMAVRRQTDTDRDVISLAHLIQQVSRYPHVLSRDRYAARVAYMASREEADRGFDFMVGAGRDHIDPNVPKADLARLRSRTGKVLGWANNEVAHYNESKGQFGVGLTFGDLHDSVDLIVDLAVKYRDLILGSSMAKSVSMTGWMEIFRVAWIPNDYQLRRIYQQTQEIEHKR